MAKGKSYAKGPKGKNPGGKYKASSKKTSKMNKTNLYGAK